MTPARLWRPRGGVWGSMTAPRQIIVTNPAIMGGMPTIRGTRITAQSILGRLESGDSVESVLEDYPYLDRDAVEAAALYAKANPPRGRPGGKLWRRAS